MYFMNKMYGFLYRESINYLTHKLDPIFGFAHLKPLVIWASITSSCNFRCRHCTLRHSQNYELMFEEWKHIISKFRSWLGPLYLSVTGGEPLLRKDALDIIDYSNKIGIITELATNSYLVDKNIAEKIIKIELDKLRISVDGIGKTHDHIRGVKGAFDRIEKSIKYINSMKQRHGSEKPKIYLGTTIMKCNLDEITEIVKFAEKNDCSVFLRPVLPYLSGGSTKKCCTEGDIWPLDKDAINRTIAALIEMKKGGFYIANSEINLRLIETYLKNPHVNFKKLRLGCGAPFRTLKIKSNGDLYVCNIKLGSALKDNIAIIRRNLKRANMSLENCDRACRFEADLDERLIDKFNRARGILFKA